MSNLLLFCFVILTAVASRSLAAATSVGVFKPLSTDEVIRLYPASLRTTISQSFIPLNVSEPRNFEEASTTFDLLNSLVSNSGLVAVLGMYSPVLGSMALELDITYYVIDTYSVELTQELLNLRRFLAMGNLSDADTPSQWAFNSASSSIFNENTKVLTSKLTYITTAKAMIYQALNPAYPQVNTTADVALFSPNIISAATFLASPLIFPIASTNAFIISLTFLGTKYFVNATDNIENIYQMLRSLRNNGYTVFIMDVNVGSALPDIVYKIPLDLGMMINGRIWSFLRWENNPTFVTNTPDTPAWSVAANDAHMNAEAGTQNNNLLYQLILYLLNSIVGVSVTVPNSYNFNVYGPSISRFQDMLEIRMAQVYNGTLLTTNLWQIGCDILGRTTYITYLQSNLTTANQTSLITSYTSLAGLTITIAIVLDPPFVMMNTTSGQPYGIAIEVIQQLSWYIGFNYNFTYVSNYGAGSGVIKYLNQSTNLTFTSKTGGPVFFALSGLYYTASDSASINFVEPYITPIGVNLILRNNTASTTWQFMQPFSTGIFILLAISVVLLPAAFTVLDLIVRNDPNKHVFSPAGSFWYVYGALTMAAVDTLPTRFSTKVLTLVMVFAYLILIVAYQAGLITLYYFPRIDNNINNVTSVVTANSNGVSYPVVMLIGSIPWRYLNAYNQTTTASLIQRMPTPVLPLMAQIVSTVFSMNQQFSNQLITLVSNYSQLLPNLQLNGNSTTNVVLGTNLMNQWLQNQDCGLRIVGDPVDIRYISLGTPIGALYAEELSKALSALQSNNSIANIVNYYTVSTCAPADGAFPLRINDLAGIYYVLAVGFGLSFLFAIVQRAHYANQITKWRKRAPPLRFGHMYAAVVKEITPDGATIDISGQPKLYQLPSRNFNPNSGLPTSPDMNDVSVGDTIEVKYFGRDMSTKKRLFVFIKKLQSSRG